MARCLAISFSAWLTFFTLSAGPGSAADAPKLRRLIYNSDGGNIFIDKKPPMRPADVHAYVDEVAGTRVTTFFMCPQYCMPMLYPSKVTEMIGGKLSPERRRQVEKIGTAERNSTERAILNLEALVAAGHDPVGLVVDRCRAKKLEVFITFRLNEIHEVDKPASLVVSEFWRKHPEWRVGKIGDPVGEPFRKIIGPRVSPVVAGWFPGALNFAVPEVRQLRLAELRECCERYPIDGLDLDFQRFPIYFPPVRGKENVPTMTAWLREVRAMTREVGVKRGRPLLLSARVLARPEQGPAIGSTPLAGRAKG